MLDAIRALNLALEYDIPEMIKRLRYEVARVGSEQWVEIARRLTSDHSPDLYLPIEELVLLSIAREALMAQWVAVATTPPVNFGTSRGDDGVVCCEQTPDRLVEWNKLVHESGVFQEWLHDPIYGLDVLSELPWARLGYCKRCIWERKDFWQHEKKRELWDDFDNLLGPESRINICEHSLC